MSVLNIPFGPGEPNSPGKPINPVAPGNPAGPPIVAPRSPASP